MQNPFRDRPTFVSFIGLELTDASPDHAEGRLEITEDHLVGARARVAVPVGAGRRGRVMVDIDGRTVGMVAEAYRDLRESFAQDDQVVVVEVRDGVARIAPMDDIE